MRALPLLLLAACAAPPQVGLHPRPAGEARAWQEVDVSLGGEPFLTCRLGGQRGAALFPLLAPGGVPVTRAFPFAEVPGEPRDHPHHHSCWFTHGAVNGVDFWAGQGRIVLEDARAGAAGTLHLLHRWVGPGDTVVCTDRRELAFHGGDGWRAVDVRVTLEASAGAVTLGDTKEGTMGLRLRPELGLEGKGAAGTIANSEGHRDAAAWGKRARWVCYRGTVAGRPVAVAMFDHPANHGHPTWWHARGYGLCAANPFGAHDFAGLPPGTGDLVIPSGTELTLRYRVWLAAGPVDDEEVEDAFQAWAAGG